ncbi:MAG: short-chain fatty acyl-CoA regulator family protein [Pseudomonadota bacterium]
MARSLVGSRIRELRRRSGISQTALATRVGISPSYLNLIEHNKRGIGGQILNAIADALETRPAQLSEGGHPTLIADLQVAAEDGQAPVEAAEELATRFPGWAELAAAHARKIRDQEGVIAALSDRLTHDPFLSETVHGILSNITAIRSTASILAQMDTIPADQVKRFHEGLHSESVRLSSTAQELADYLSKAGSQAAGAATAEETLDQFLARNAYTFDALDREAEALGHLPREAALARMEGVIGEMLSAEPALSGFGEDLARRHLRTYAEDALAMPLQSFAEAARQAGFDPLALAPRWGNDLHALFRRLASLRRPLIEAPAFGLLTVSASGYPLRRQPLPGFSLPRHGNACPLWPVFRAFAQSGQMLSMPMEHDSGQIYTALAYASPRPRSSLSAPADLVASMLFVAAEASPFPEALHGAQPVGTACRICTREGCAARTAAQLLQA